MKAMWNFLRSTLLLSFFCSLSSRAEEVRVNYDPDGTLIHYKTPRKIKKTSVNDSTAENSNGKSYSVALAAPTPPASNLGTDLTKALLSPDLMKQLDGSAQRLQTLELNNYAYGYYKDTRWGRPTSMTAQQEAEARSGMAQQFNTYAKNRGTLNFLESKEDSAQYAHSVENVMNNTKMEVETSNHWKISSGLNPMNSKTYVSASNTHVDMEAYSVWNVFTGHNYTPSYSLLKGSVLDSSTIDTGVRSGYNINSEYRADTGVNFTQSIWQTGFTRKFTPALSSRFETSYSLVEAPRSPVGAQVSLLYSF